MLTTYIDCMTAASFLHRQVVIIGDGAIGKVPCPPSCHCGMQYAVTYTELWAVCYFEEALCAMCCAVLYNILHRVLCCAV